MFRYVYEVARNHSRILNHIDLIRTKLDIGNRLELTQKIDRLCDNSLERRKLFRTYIERLMSCENRDRQKYINKITPIGLLELHPTDICDLSCIKCYYSRSPDTLPIKMLLRLLKILQPKGIVLVGGGEPTLYYDEETKSDFSSLILTIKKTLPYVKLGLITNGLRIPQGKWLEQVDWLRLSIDAATANTYKKLKGKDSFIEVISNLVTYLESDIQHIGAGFLCNRLNINEVTEFIRLVQRILEPLPVCIQRKVNIQFRQFRKRPEFSNDTRIETQDLSCTETQIQKVSLAFKEMRKDSTLAYFMDTASNWEKVTDLTLRKRQFDHCYRAISYKLLRPNGDLYPCFVHVDNPEYILGNIRCKDLEREVLLGELMGFYYFNCCASYCSSELCPLFRENAICTEYFHGQKMQLSRQAIDDPFY